MPAFLLAGWLAAVPGCRRAERDKTVEPSAVEENTKGEIKPPTLDARLIFLPGPPAGDSLLIVRLFSLSNRQFACRPGISNQPPNAPAPVMMNLEGSFWAEKTRVLAATSNGTWQAARALELRLVDPGPTGAVALASMDSLSARYLVPASAKLRPGDRLRSETVLPSPWPMAVSREVVVPPATIDIRINLQRRAMVEEQTGDFEALLKTGDDLIAAWSNRPVGFWYRARALEGLTRREEALAFYRQALQVALENAPKNAEPPIPIIESIARLSRGP
jgi:hypothetical protein